MQKLIDDCYYFYYSTCTKNEACPYRHCEKALGSEMVCKKWLNKTCIDLNCPFRHMAITKNRSQIPCYWESTTSGCQKPFCPFFHRQVNQEKTDLTSTATPQQTTQTQKNLNHQLSSSNRVILNENQNNNENKDLNNKLNQINEQTNFHTTCVVSPVIVQMNQEDEESDYESEQDPPLPPPQPKILNHLEMKSIKSPTNNNNNNGGSEKKKAKVVSIKRLSTEQPELKLEVKSLEEIRKEKAALRSLEVDKETNIEKKVKSGQRNVTESEKRLIKFATTDKSSQELKKNVTESKEKVQIEEKQNFKRKKTIVKEKNVINLIKTTLADNLIVEPVAETNKISTPTLSLNTPTSNTLSTLKIKTLEEIKAEKEEKIKSNLLKQQIDIEKQKQNEELEKNKTKLEQTTIPPEINDEQKQSSIETNMSRKLRLIKKPTKENLVQTSELNLVSNSEIQIISNEKHSIKMIKVDNNNKRKMDSNVNASISNFVESKKLKSLNNLNDVMAESDSTIKKNVESDELKQLTQTKSIDSIDIDMSSSKTRSRLSSSDLDESFQKIQKNSNQKVQQKQPTIYNDIDKEMDELMMLCGDEDDLL